MTPGFEAEPTVVGFVPRGAELQHPREWERLKNTSISSAKRDRTWQGG